MNKFKNLVLSICVLQFLGCGEKECIVTIKEQKANNIELKIIKDNCNDRLLKEQEFLKISPDSMIPHGLYKEYFKNGKISSFAFFKNGLQDSIAIKYYQNGNKELEFYWQDGIQIGFQSIYNQNGKYQRRDYFLRDSIKMFLLTYNEDGRIEHLEGPLFHISYNKEVDNLRLGEEINIVNEVITLENAETLLTLKFTDPNKKTLVDTTVKQFLVFKNLHFIPIVYSPKERGDYQYSLKVQLIDKSNGNLLKADSTNFAITVK
ncbi:MAG: hypothetical protein WC756_10875 [Taibaiella sp.]|jgi:hypothetical protein